MPFGSFPPPPNRDPMLSVIENHSKRIFDMERRILPAAAAAIAAGASGAPQGTWVGYYGSGGLQNLGGGHWGLNPGHFNVWADGGAVAVDGVHLQFANNGVVIVAVSGSFSVAGDGDGLNAQFEITTDVLGGFHPTPIVADLHSVGGADLSGSEIGGSGTYVGPIAAGDLWDFTVDAIDAPTQLSAIQIFVAYLTTFS